MENKPEPKKSYIKPHFQKHARIFTHHNVRGFLISCTQNREGYAVTEVIHLLKSARKILIPEMPELEEWVEHSKMDDVDEFHQQTYHDNLLPKVTTTKTLESKKLSSFQVYDAGCKGRVFVGIRHPVDPVKFILRTFEILANGTISLPDNTFIERIIPVQKVSMANIESILETLTPMIDKNLNEFSDPISWGIITHQRNCNSVDRKSILDHVASLVDPKHPVNLTSPQITILIEITKSACCISITPDFHLLHKYNPRVFLDKNSPSFHQ